MASGDEHAQRGVSEHVRAWANSLSDDEIVDRLRPAAAGDWLDVLNALIPNGRAGVVRRVVERGILAPDAPDETGRAIVCIWRRRMAWWGSCGS